MSSASGISFSGLGSGIDTATIVSQLMSLERQPITNIQRDKTKVQSRQGVVQEINTLLKTLRDKALALKDGASFAIKTASSTDATVATALADATAAKGAYNLTVTALSKAHTQASVASPVISADTLHLTVGTTTANVALTGTETLQQVADKINGAADTPVAASVVNNKLVLISKTTGAAGAMTVTSDGGLAGALGLGTTQPGQDAGVTVNGLPVTASGNTVAGAIAGVTLTLTKEGTTTVNVGLDGAKIEGKVKEFVDAYNSLIDNLSRATKYDIATKTKGTLQGDQTMQSLMGQLRGIASSAVTGLPSAYDSLAQIGVTTATDRSGKLVINSTTLQNALSADASAVANVFGKDDGVAGSGPGDGIAFQLHALSDTISKDVLATRLTGFTDQLSRMDKKIADLEVVMGLKEKRLRSQFTAMETAISNFRSQGADLAARLGTA